MKVIKVRYVKPGDFAYETEDDLKVNMFCWCKVKDKLSGQEYEQLAVVTKECDAAEAEQIREELSIKKSYLKKARKFAKPGG